MQRLRNMKYKFHKRGYGSVGLNSNFGFEPSIESQAINLPLNHANFPWIGIKKELAEIAQEDSADQLETQNNPDNKNSGDIKQSIEMRQRSLEVPQYTAFPTNEMF